MLKADKISILVVVLCEKDRDLIEHSSFKCFCNER